MRNQNKNRKPHPEQPEVIVAAALDLTLLLGIRSGGLLGR